MASVTTDPNGHRRIQFTDPHGKRPTLRLGKVSKKDAQAVRVKVESLLASKLSGQPVEPETARWVARIGDTLHARLAAVGLVEPRASATLGAYLGDWLRLRAVGVKPGTTIVRQQAADIALQYWPAHTPLASVGVGDIEAFDAWMRSQRTLALSEATVHKRAQVLKRAWEHARRRGLIGHNLWADAEVKTSPGTNTNRQRYIPVPDVQRLIDELPAAEWRAMVALARFAGVRIPSEPQPLTWADID